MRSAIRFVTFFAAFLAASFSAVAVQNGPAPTSASVNAAGTFATASVAVASSSSLGFGGGTIYYPTAAGTYGVIALCPGFTATQTSVAWLAQRLATHGFVTIAMNTNNAVLDSPASRGTQLRAALTYLTGASAPAAVKPHVDATRKAVYGHSMGGGGVLYALSSDKTIKAGFPMAPFNTATTNFSTITSATMILTGTADTTAPGGTFGLPMYNSIPAATKKAYALLNGAVHSTFSANPGDERVGRYGVLWAKQFVDADTRYTSFLCGADQTAYNTPARFTSYLSTCPY
jgi:dienelactone hydrolase